MICPCDTPDGEQCGLAKSMALMAIITTDESERNIVQLCISFGVEEISHYNLQDIY